MTNNMTRKEIIQAMDSARTEAARLNKIMDSIQGIRTAENFEKMEKLLDSLKNVYRTMHILDDSLLNKKHK